MKLSRTVFSLAALALIITGAVLYAGPLNPPAGPVASTYKTLAEVEPRIAINATNTPGDATSVFKITEPGSYYLTGNTGTIPAAKHGILIAAPNVTLDLGGFLISSSGFPGNALDGVSAAASTSNIVVRNGIVRGMNGMGINLVNTTSSRIENIQAFANNNGGIAAGTASLVDSCVAYSNFGDGISISRGVVSNCTAQYNFGDGISISSGGTVSNCASLNNNNAGIFGGRGITVSDCSASDNTRIGILIQGGEVTNCSAYQNGANGIETTTIGSTVSNCTVYFNSGIGIVTREGSTVTNCSAYNNNSHGISTIGGCSVLNCTARANLLHGIECSSTSVIRGNTCSFNGSGGVGAGIHATGTDNRIEGNNCTTADRGIDVDNAGNIIIRNTCSGNTTDWFIGANNVVGPILDRRAPANASINGFSAPSSLGTTDPNANFSY